MPQTPEAEQFLKIFQSIQLPEETLRQTQQTMVRLMGELASEMMAEDQTQKEKKG